MNKHETTLETLLEDYPENVPVAVAAKLLGKSPNWVQWGNGHQASA